MWHLIVHTRHVKKFHCCDLGGREGCRIRRYNFGCGIVTIRERDEAMKLTTHKSKRLDPPKKISPQSIRFKILTSQVTWWHILAIKTVSHVQWNTCNHVPLHYPYLFSGARPDPNVRYIGNSPVHTDSLFVKQKKLQSTLNHWNGTSNKSRNWMRRGLTPSAKIMTQATNYRTTQKILIQRQFFK